MKRLILLLLLFAAVSIRGQDVYNTIKNIHYYTDSIDRKDAYIHSQCTIDLYYPQNKKNYATIVWFHGGGLTGGDKEIPQALMNKGYAVIGVGYRLSPKVTSPAYIEDAAAAVAWAFHNIETYGGSDKLIVVSGHSAGGYLGMMVTLDTSYLARYAVNANNIAALVPFSGQAITHFTVRAEKGIKATQATIDQYAPLYFVRSNAPRMLLITGDRELELLGRYEENAYLLRMMKLAGHTRTRLYELQGFDHVHMPEPAFPLLLREVSEVVKEKSNTR